MFVTETARFSKPFTGSCRDEYTVTITMANESISNLAIYRVCVQNHSESGTFQAVIDDLPRFV